MCDIASDLKCFDFFRLELQNFNTLVTVCSTLTDVIYSLSLKTKLSEK